MKKLKKIIYLPLLLLPIIIILNIYNYLPSKIVITEGYEYSFDLKYPLSISEKDVLSTVSSGNEALVHLDNKSVVLNSSSCGNYNFLLKLFNKIPLKTVSVTVAPAKYVIPSGDSIGIKLYTKGIIVVALSDFILDNGQVCSPGKDAGLKKGDIITEVNGKSVTTSEEFSKSIQDLNIKTRLTIIRDNTKLTIEVMPKKPADSQGTKLGIWVRDSTAGIGTLTYYDPENSTFSALGHGICDADTGEIMMVRRGSILTCDIMSIKKGLSGTPGELMGSFGDYTIGKINENNELGIYGRLNDTENIELNEKTGVATRFQTKEGHATILADVDGAGVKEYSAQILKVSKNAKVDNKGLVLQITDERLLEKTGGIVQGMSGSPIIQNGMLVGAVTHVFVNDPTKGYGIFAENLINITNTLN